MYIFYEGGVYGHQKCHVEKTKSILNDDIIVGNDHEQPSNVSVTRGLTPPRSPSSIFFNIKFKSNFFFKFYKEAKKIE